MGKKSIWYNCTKEDLKTILLNEYKILDKSPSSTYMNKQEYLPSAKIFYRVFETQSWSLILSECGLDLNSNKEYSDDFLKEEFFRWVNNHNGKIPTKDDMLASEGYVSTYLYLKHYKTNSWNDILRKMNLTPSQELWKKKEIEFLTLNWNKYTDEELSNIINRTSNAIKYKRQELGLIKEDFRNTWDEEEVKYLIDNFYNETPEKLKEKLKRSYNAISSYAHKVLKINRKHGKFLSKDKKMRQCKCCETWYPNNEKYFYKDKNTLRSECINCTQENSEQKSREKGILTKKLKQEMFDKGYRYCGNCKQWKKIDDFYKTNNKESIEYNNYHHWCSECESAYHVARSIKEKINILLIQNWSIKELITIINLIKSNTNINYLKEEYSDKENYIEVFNIIDNHLNFKGFGKSYISSDGKQCLSLPELIISEFFIKNTISYIKEQRYSSILNNKNDLRRLDFTINLNDKKYYIEYFGLYNTKSNSKTIKKYVKKARKKIKDLYKAGVIDKCIFIFPNDIKDNTAEGLQRKLESFLLSKYNIDVKKII